MTTFALVHGAWHGAWCWDALAAELSERGHSVVAVDLPCEEAGLGAGGYARVVLDASQDIGDDPVVVGHSLGGCTIPLVAAARSVRHLVFLTTAIPEPGRSLVETLAAEPQSVTDPLADLEPVEGAFLRFPADRPQLLYNGCDAAVTSWAIGNLRLQSLQPLVEPFQLDRFPDVPRTVILGSEDLLMDVGLTTPIAERRLGVTPVVIRSGHSPFLSMPAQLADLLTERG